MKKMDLLCLLFFSGCTATSPQTSMRWSGAGEKPDLTKYESQLKPQNTQASAGEEIEFSEQRVSGFRIESSFVKSIKKNKNLIFQSAKLTNKVSALTALQANRLDQNKTRIWSLFTENHLQFARDKLVFPLEVIFITEPRMQAAIYAVTESPQKKLRAFYLNENADLLRDEFVGSSLTDMIESPSFVFTLGPKKSPLSPINIVRLPLAVGLSDHLIDVSSLSPAKVTSPGSLEYPTTDTRFDDVQAFYYSHQILQWFDQKWGFKLTSSLNIITHLDFPEKTNAAFYFNNQIRLGTGDGVIYSDIAWDPSIVMHETAHAVIDALSHLPFQGEGGSLNEGFADVFTTFYLDNPLLGENSYLAGPYRRTVDQILKLSEKNGGLYHDSAIVSGFFWSLKKQLGSEPSLRLALHVLNRLGPNSGFADFDLALHEQSIALFSAEDLKKVEQLMKERELL